MEYRLTVFALSVLLLAGCGADQGATYTEDNEATERVVATAMQVEADDHLIYHPDEIEWQPGPASFEEGSEYAILEGDPGEAGFFTMRIKMPDGFEIAPHWHPNVERVSILSGTFLLGSGDVVNRAAAEALEPGSYFSMPPEMRHFAVTEGETVVQLTSIGPWEINYVDQADDPRAR